jgi:hypothetical protein
MGLSYSLSPAQLENGSSIEANGVLVIIRKPPPRTNRPKMRWVLLFSSSN